MNLKKLSYIILVIVLSVSLFLGFIVDTFNVDIGYLNNVLKKSFIPICVGCWNRFCNVDGRSLFQIQQADVEENVAVFSCCPWFRHEH